MRLSLCLIARNEEAMLPGLFSSVRGVVDRIILVDTGSSDRTVELARAAGAIVVFHPWNEDFAAARNAALSEVHEGWVLQMDADERLAPGASSILATALSRTDLDGYLLPLHNASRLDASPKEILSGVARIDAPVLLPRLLRWTPELRWKHRVHERPQTGDRWAVLDLPLLHLGYAPEFLRHAQKTGRNLRLLELRCAETPEDLEGLTYLAFEYFQAGRPDDAVAPLQKGWFLLQHRLAEGTKTGISLGTMYTQWCLERGEIAAAQEAIHRLRQRLPPHPNLLWLEGRLLSLREDYPAMEEVYRRMLRLPTTGLTEPIVPTARIDAERGLGISLLRQGKHLEAEAIFRTLLQKNPDDPTAKNGLTELHACRTQPADRIFLCVIARNEEAMLPGLLASVEGMVDEVVLVDTGSTDRTVELARNAGATIIFSPWQEHFAQARNAALSVAGKGWILMLDADERLAPGSGPLLREACRAASIDVWLLPLHNASRMDASATEILSGTARRDAPILLPRLFRRTPDFYWQRRVHESPHQWLLQRRGRIGESSIPILHFGYVDQQRVTQEKRRRNLRLLQRRCSEFPEDPTGFTHLALECYNHPTPGSQPIGDAAIEQGWASLRDLLSEGRPCPPIVALTTLRTQRLLEGGQLAEAEGCLALARRESPGHPNLDWMEGWLRLFQTLQGQDTLHAAEQAFRRALAAHGRPTTEPVFSGSSSWGALDGLGNVLLLAGRPAEAESCFAAISKERPEQSQYGIWEAHLDQGRAASVIGELQPRLVAALSSGDGGPRDLWALATLACLSLGAKAEAEEFMKRALKPGTWRSYRRQVRLLALHGRMK